MKQSDCGHLLMNCQFESSDRRSLEHHLNSCPQCRLEHQAVRGIDRLLSSFLNVIPDSDNAREKVKVRIREFFNDGGAGQFSLRRS
jgi:hypothetical protein